MMPANLNLIAAARARCRPRTPDRDGLSCSRAVAGWRLWRPLEPQVEAVLKSIRHHQRGLCGPAHPATLSASFLAYYDRQTEGAGIHSRVCLPVGGWKSSQSTAKKCRPDAVRSTFTLNRAVIERGCRRLVYY
jgi:hypothetical protein